VIARYRLGAAGPRIEIDDAYIGGERTGDGSGRGRRGHTPFIVAIETSADGGRCTPACRSCAASRPVETRRLCARVEAGTTIVSDGGQWVSLHRRTAGHHPRAPCHRLRSSIRASPCFPAGQNTILANVKNSLLAAHRAVGAKHLPRYSAPSPGRFNRRFVLKTIHERLAIAGTTTPPMALPSPKIS